VPLTRKAFLKSLAGLDSAILHAEDPVVGGMEIRDGTIHLPDAPGFWERIRKAK
jgi:L-alanine-DL-glutamate epimerase-like enolase superfamily enzyme